jgi:hypothetical protein
MNWKKLTIGAVVLAGLTMPTQVFAVPNLTLSPTTQTVANGSQFDVIMGIDSGIEKVIGVDIVSTFDASKLEIVSVVKGTVPDTGYNFTFTSSSPIIKNDTGRLEVTLPSANSSVYEGVVAKHELLKVTFKAKAVGTAVVNYSCTAGSVTDSNIINQAGSDVIDCASNSSGSYTITEGSSVVTTPVPTVVGAVAATTLPDTGGIETTAGLMIFGLSTVAAALWLAKL